MHLQVVQIVTFVVAFSLAATRILTASRPFWAFLPAWLSGALPALLVAVPALGEAVVGVKTGVDLTVAILVAVALALPGFHSHTLNVKTPGGPGPASFGAGFALCATIAGCAGLRPALKSVDDAAVILCDVFFAKQPRAMSLSPEDVEKAFCSTAEQVAPFLDSANRAMGRAGAMRLGRTEQ